MIKKIINLLIFSKIIASEIPLKKVDFKGIKTAANSILNILKDFKELKKFTPKIDSKSIPMMGFLFVPWLLNLLCHNDKVYKEQCFDMFKEKCPDLVKQKEWKEWGNIINAKKTTNTGQYAIEIVNLIQNRCLYNFYPLSIRIFKLETEIIKSKNYINYFLSQLSSNMISFLFFHMPLIIIILHGCNKDTSIWKHIIGATLSSTMIKMINYALFKTIKNDKNQIEVEKKLAIQKELNKIYSWKNLNSKYINYFLGLCILLIKLNNTNK